MPLLFAWDCMLRFKAGQGPSDIYDIAYGGEKIAQKKIPRDL